MKDKRGLIVLLGVNGKPQRPSTAFDERRAAALALGQVLD
jgi:hypothetical protein